MRGRALAMQDRRPRVTWAFCLTLCASVTGCSFGEREIPIGSDARTTFYVSPAGDDANSGRRSAPWRTFAHALGELAPGHTLLLIAGEYTLDSTGLLEITCEEAAAHGSPDRPIVVRAEEERRAVLWGDGERAPLRVDGCQHWQLEGLVLINVDRAGLPDELDLGSTAVVTQSEHVALSRVLALHTNRETHSHLLRVTESSEILVEEWEGYDFHQNAFEAVRSRAVTFRRNYLHSRFAASAGSATDLPERGDRAILLEETADSLIENNVMEAVTHGVAIVGRPNGSSFTDPPPLTNDGNRVLGNVVLDASESGYLIESRCEDTIPCVNSARIVTDTELADNVTLSSPVGLLVEGAPGTRVLRHSAFRTTSGVVLSRSAANLGLEVDARVENSLAHGFSAVGFSATGLTAWEFDHCATAAPGSGATAFSPADTSVRHPLAPGDVGACRVYPSPGSALRGAGAFGSHVGASVLFRYEGGVLTTQPLWDLESGAFPCAAVVPGINDDPSASCSAVHERLAIGSAGCPLAFP